VLVRSRAIVVSPKSQAAPARHAPADGWFPKVSGCWAAA
jgi:hypothetical protein